jgi:hypothetical protein
VLYLALVAFGVAFMFGVSLQAAKPSMKTLVAGGAAIPTGLAYVLLGLSHLHSGLFTAPDDPSWGWAGLTIGLIGLVVLAATPFVYAASGEMDKSKAVATARNNPRRNQR